MRHMKAIKIADYVTGRMQGEERMELEKHIAQCRECAERVHAHNYIRDNFDEVFDSWLAFSSGLSEPFSQIADSLVHASRNRDYSEIRSRIESWLSRVRSEAGIAWCAAVGTVSGAVDEIIKNFEILPPQVVLAVRTRGGVKTEGKVSIEPKVLQTSGESPPKDALSVESIEGAAGITIKVKWSTLKDPLPLVMLMPEAGGEPIVRDFKKARGGLVAEFKDLPNVKYYVVVEGNSTKKAES